VFQEIAENVVILVGGLADNQNASIAQTQRQRLCFGINPDQRLEHQNSSNQKLSNAVQRLLRDSSDRASRLSV
jgi:hypothetical protein